MSKFEQYNIVLKDIKEGSRTIELILDDAYFKKIDSPEVQKGNVKATVTVHKKATAYELQFNIDGFVYVPCRCSSAALIIASTDASGKGKLTSPIPILIILASGCSSLCCSTRLAISENKYVAGILMKFSLIFAISEK